MWLSDMTGNMSVANYLILENGSSVVSSISLHLIAFYKQKSLQVFRLLTSLVHGTATGVLFLGMIYYRVLQSMKFKICDRKVKQRGRFINSKIIIVQFLAGKAKVRGVR